MRTLVLALLALAGCTPRLRLDPAALPSARVGERYHEVVTVREHRTPVGGVSTLSLPPGLTLAHKDMDETFTIDGVPTTAGDFPVVIDGWCYGTNFAGQKLHAEVTLHVLPR